VVSSFFVDLSASLALVSASVVEPVSFSVSDVALPESLFSPLSELEDFSVSFFSVSDF